MSGTEAVREFQERRLNCAQSIFWAFQERYKVPPEKIQEAKNYGGGRAPLGRCGALHAALELAKDPHTQEWIAKNFLEKAGSELCKEIRKQKRISCAGCVELASDLLLHLISSSCEPLA